MALCAFVGDELTAAGFRLAGLEIHRPPPEGPSALFEQLCGETQLILLTAEIAAALPAERLRQVWLAGRPLVLVLADARHLVPAPDLMIGVRRQLGLAE